MCVRVCVSVYPTIISVTSDSILYMPVLECKITIFLLSFFYTFYFICPHHAGFVWPDENLTLTEKLTVYYCLILLITICIV